MSIAKSYRTFITIDLLDARIRMFVVIVYLHFTS